MGVACGGSRPGQSTTQPELTMCQSRGHRSPMVMKKDAPLNGDTETSRAFTKTTANRAHSASALLSEPNLELQGQAPIYQGISYQQGNENSHLGLSKRVMKKYCRYLRPPSDLPSAPTKSSLSHAIENERKRDLKTLSDEAQIVIRLTRVISRPCEP